MPRYKDDPIRDLNMNGARALRSYVHRLKEPGIKSRQQKAMLRRELQERGVLLLRHQQTQINGMIVDNKWVKAVVNYDPSGQTGSEEGQFFLNGTPVPRSVVDRAIRFGVAH